MKNFLSPTIAPRPQAAESRLQQLPEALREEIEALNQERTEELLRANAALQESEKRYRAFAELSSDYTFSVQVKSSGKAILEWATDALSRVIGYTVEDLNRLGWHSILVSEDLPVCNEQFQTVLTNRPDTREFRVRTKKGEVRWLRHYMRPEWDETEGRAVRIYGAVQDITEHKQVEAALKSSEERLKILFEFTPDAYYLSDLTGRFVDGTVFPNTAPLLKAGAKKQK